MSVILLDSGVLRVPTSTELPDGTRVDGVRDIAPDEPDYAAWRPYAITEGDDRRAVNAAILRRWGVAASA